jgi:nucleoside phosphorylase
MILICSAWREENKYLRNNSLSTDFLFLDLGIAYLNSALNLERYLLNLKEKPSQIIFLGTAGSFEGIDIGDISSVSKVSLLMSTTRMKLAYTPLKEEDLTINKKSEEKFSDIKSSHCFSSLGISQSKFLYLELKKEFKNEILVENMELFGLAKVASDHKIPWEAYLGITNHIGARAHQEWKQSHAAVSEKLNNWFIEKYTK